VVFLGAGLLNYSYAFEISSSRFSYFKGKSCKNVFNSPKMNSIDPLLLTLSGTQWPTDVVRDGLKVMELNSKNFGVPPEKNEHEMTNGFESFQKTKENLESLEKLIETNNPALIVLIEVYNKETMVSFDKEFLKDKYEEILIEGNDGRSVDLGLWVRKDLPIEIEIHTHKNLVNSATNHLIFSRDLPTYIIREKRDGTVAKNPFLILQGTHYKSQRGDDPKDPGSDLKRREQSDATAELIVQYERMYPKTPIAVVGDFNNEMRANRSPEFSALRILPMHDAFDVAPDTVPESERVTHYFFPKGEPVKTSQMDTMLINDEGVNKKVLKSAKVLHHLTASGEEIPSPNTFRQREKQLSDHKPTLYIFDLENLLAEDP